MHYYQHHIGDFIKATARLSDTQSMAYLRLLWMYYDSEKPLKPDTKVLAFQIGASVEETQLLLESFFWLAENGWHHTRCDQEIAEYRSFLDKKSNAGKASAERRKNIRSTGVEQLLNSSPSDEQLTTNQQPLTNNQSKEAKASPDLGKPKSAPACPVAEIVEMYNTMLPMLPAVSVVNDSRKRAIAARWREVVTTEKMDRQQGLEFFQWFFKMVKDSKFLTGKTKDWKADLDFLFNPSKFPRIVEGAYHEDKK
jgi:uncharacterized protein YdaU (DUF1376 family)